MALVEVHRELARVSMGAKEMVIKKSVWKTIKHTQAQLHKAEECIAELKCGTTTA